MPVPTPRHPWIRHPDPTQPDTLLDFWLTVHRPMWLETSTVPLCVATWARRLYRHRLFESNVRLLAPPHPDHRLQQVKMGRPAGPGQAYVAVGNFPQVDAVRRQMEMPWADRRGIAESIPPIFGDYVGRQVLGHVLDQQAA